MAVNTVYLTAKLNNESFTPKDGDTLEDFFGIQASYVAPDQRVDAWAYGRHRGLALLAELLERSYHRVEVTVHASDAIGPVAVMTVMTEV